MRRANHRPFLSFARTAGLLPLLFPRLASNERDGLNNALKTYLHASDSILLLVLKVIRHVRHHDAFFEQQCALQKQRILIVQQVLPPLCRDKLR